VERVVPQAVGVHQNATLFSKLLAAYVQIGAQIQDGGEDFLQAYGKGEKYITSKNKVEQFAQAPFDHCKVCGLAS
jgi:hypothetical protein